MAELDLSLSDALTDSAPQPGPDDVVQRDFVAELEAEHFEDKVGEMVGKTEYVPLLDNDDTRAAAGPALENGEQEVHGVQKPGSELTPSASHPEPQGEVRPHAPERKQDPATDVSSGFSQPGVMGINVDVVAAPFQAERPPSIAEPQHPIPPAGSAAPKEHSPMLPEPQTPRSPLDLSAGPLGDCWPDEAGYMPTDLPFTPSVSTVISRHAGNLATSPEPPDGWPSRESTAYAGGDEREGDGSDRKQKKKKKRRQKDEGSYEHVEGRDQPEAQAQGENAPPAEEFYHRIGPRRDKGESGWEDQLGKSGGRAKRGKSRKKLPEEWGVMAEPFVPATAESSRIKEEVAMDVGGSGRANLGATLADMDTSQSPCKTEAYPEDSLVPAPTSPDPSPGAASISPQVLNSELKATAAPFTMPPAHAAFPDDPFDLLMDTEHAGLGNSSQAFSPPFSPGNEASSGDMVDSGIFDNTGCQGASEGDNSAVSPASQPSQIFSPRSEALASAPPLSPSDASWLLSESQISSNAGLSDLIDISPSGPPLPLGLSFETPSPAPLRSPKTTAQEFQLREHRDAKPSHNQAKKPRSSSSSSPLKSPSSPGNKTPLVSPLSSPSGNPLGIPGSGLNPAAKPFFPSFADPTEEPAVVPPAAPTLEVKSEKVEMKVEMKEEKLADSVEKADVFDPLDKAEQKSVKVEFASSERPAKVEQEVEKEDLKKKKKESEAEEMKEKEADKVKEEKEAEKQPEKMKETTKETDKESKLNKAEESAEQLVKTERVDEEVEKVGTMDNNEKSVVEGKSGEKTEMKDDKEQQQTPEQPPTPVGLRAGPDEAEKAADTQAKPELENKEEEKADTVKTEDEDKMEKPVPKEAERGAAQADRQTVETQDEKTDKAAKADGEEKVRKTKPAANGSSAAASKDLGKKTKPAAGATKPSAGAKMRPSSAASAGGLPPAPTKRLRPSPPTSTSDKKPAAAKAPSAAAAAPKQPGTASASRPSSSATAATRDVKPKTTADKRPPVPKTSTATSSQTRNGSAGTTAASRTIPPVRTTVSARTTGTTAAKKPAACKTDGKAAEEKKPSALKTSTANSAKPRTTTAAPAATRTTAPTPAAAASRARTAAPKAATPASSTGTAPEKKPPVPRVPRVASSTAAAASRTTARPGTAPAPDTRNARSKVGSADNMKPQAAGGRVPSASQNRGVASKETSHGKVQILNKKVDVSKVTSKCGSKDNIKHKPGGGDVKIESHKVNFKDKAQSKVGSMDNVSHSPGGGNVKAEGAQETAEGDSAPHVGTPAPGSEPGPTGSPTAQENGLKDGAPRDSEGLREPQALDSGIPETN